MASARIALQDASDEGLSILVVLPLDRWTGYSRSWPGGATVTGEFFAVNGLSQLDLAISSAVSSRTCSLLSANDIAWPASKSAMK
jgi:hypothetical protein